MLRATCLLPGQDTDRNSSNALARTHVKVSDSLHGCCDRGLTAKALSNSACVLPTLSLSSVSVLHASLRWSCAALRCALAAWWAASASAICSVKRATSWFLSPISCRTHSGLQWNWCEQRVQGQAEGSHPDSTQAPPRQFACVNLQHRLLSYTGFHKTLEGGQYEALHKDT